MKKFLIYLLSVFAMALLIGCGNSDAESVSSAHALTKKLASESDKKIEISEDIVLTEQIEIVGKKEIIGSGTITVAAEDMKETYAFAVSEGAQLTLGGKVSLNLSGLAGGIHVKKNAAFTLQAEATVKGASLTTANVLAEGTLHMNGGTISGGYNSIICDGKSTFSWEAGTVTKSEDDAIIVGDDARITIMSADAHLTSVAARGICLYGEGVIENTTMTDSMDSMIKVGARGKLTFKNGKISDAGLHGIESAGELLVAGGTIFENCNSGICNTGTFEMTGGTLMNNKNKGIMNKSGTAKIVSAAVVLTGNRFAVSNEEGAYFELAKAKLMQSETTNVYAYGGEMYIHDIVLATSGSNNIRVVSADVRIEDTEIKGVNKSGSRTMHGLLLEGGKASVKNLLIENTTGNAIRNKGGKLTGENVTIRDINNVGIGNTNQDVTGRDGIIELTNVTVENVKNNNVLVEGGVCELRNASLERCQTNNIKVSEGKLVLKNSTVNGNVEGIKNNNHAVYMVGGTFDANNVKIQNSAGAILRVNGEKALFDGKNIIFRNAGTAGINQSIGTVKIDGLKTSDMKAHNIYMDKGTVELKNATLCKTHNNNIRVINEGNLILTNVEIQGTAAGVKEVVHGLFVSKGTTTARNLTIKDAKVSAIRVNNDAKLNLDGVHIENPGQLGMQINAGTTVVTGLTTSGVPGNNIQMFGEAKLTVKDSTLGKNKDNSIRVADNATLNLEGVVIEGHAAGTADNAHGIYALKKAILTAKNLTIKNVNGAAVRTVDTPKVTLNDLKIKNTGSYGFRLGGGTVDVTKLTTESVESYNFSVETASTNLTVKDAVLCPTKNNNVRINNGTTHFENVEIQGTEKGVKEVVHGLFVSKGTTTAKNLTIEDAKVAAIRVNGDAKLDLDGVKVVNPGELGMQISAGTTVMKGLNTSGVPGNNIQMFGDGKVTIKDSTLGKNKENSIRVADNAVLNLEDVVVEGHKEGAADNAHGIYVLNEAKVTTKNLTVKNINGAAIRTVDTPKLALYDTRILDAKSYGFRFSGGTANITKLTTENVGENNFFIETELSDITVKDAVLCPTNNNNVRITDGTVHLENTEIQGNTGKTGNVHGLFASKGTVTAKDITINNVKASGVRVSGGDVMIDGASIVNAGDRGIFASAGTTVITGLTAADNNINAYIDGTAVATVKDSIFGATAKENIKLAGTAELTLEQVAVNGKKGKDGYIFCAEGKKATLNHVVIDDLDKNDYVGIWLNADTCELTGKDVTAKNMKHAIIGNKGKAGIAGLNANAATQNIYVKGADITINGAVLEKTPDNNVKVESGRLSLNDVTVKGSTNGNTNGIFVLGTGKLEANKVQIQDAQTSAFRIKGNAEVVADNTTVSGGAYGINVNEQTLVQLTGFMTENVKTDSIVMDGSAVVTLKDSTLGASGDVAGYAVRVNGGKAKIAGLNKEAEQADIYNKSSNLSLAGTVNAFVYNDAAVSVEAFESLTGNQLTIDWAEGKIPSSMVGIQFANEDDANASKSAVRFGEITSAKYVPYIYGSQMLLNDKNQLHYIVKSYEELVSALENVEENNASDARITIAGDIVIPQTVTIKENRNISFQDDGTARKILRADSFAPAGTRGVMFDVSANAALTFRSTGNDKNPKLTIDGNKANIKATGNWAIVNAKAGSTGVNVLEGVQFINNSSTGSGSVIRMEANSGTLSIDGGQFKNNETTNTGGVINISTTSQVTIKNAAFSDNKGSNGGVMVIGDKTQVVIENCKFTKNTATGNGGAISVENKLENGTVIKNSTFEGNTANSEGGAINVPTACGLTLSDCTFTKNNSKKTGGGLAVWGNDIRLGAANSFVNISGKMVVDIFHRNTSCVNVVGSLTEGSNVVINWSGNEANRIPQGTKPAVVFASVDMMNASRDYISLGEDMVHTDYRLSYKQSDAKAYCVAVAKVSDFNGLKSALAGAEEGVTKNIRLTGNVTMTATLAVKANTEVVMEDDGTVRTILRGTNFNKKARGVFFDVNDGASFTFKGTGTDANPNLVIDGNKANIQVESGNWAIVVAIGKTSVVNVYEGTSFINNSSTGAGGVIRMQAGTLNIYGGVFKDNLVTNNYGGAVWLSGGSVANIKNAVFSGNAAGGGGAIQVNAGTTANVENAAFMNNTAGIKGGAINTDEKSILNITNSTFTGNQSKDGGAICNLGNLTLVGTDGAKAIFRDNKATANGGAVYLAAGTLGGSGYAFTNNTPDNIKINSGAINNYKE